MSRQEVDPQKALARRIDAVESLSSPPASLDRVLSLAGDAESSVPQLAAAIELDPSITARVLRLANSAYFGFSRHVETVDEAIMVIGFRNVRNLAACAAVAPMFATSQRGLDRSALWRHSCAVGEAARLIAARIDGDDGWAYVAGLLHDLGQVLLEEVLADEYVEIVQAERDGSSLADAEREALGADHAWAVGTLADRWQLSKRITSAVGLHHGPYGRCPEAALVGLAEQLAAGLGLDDANDPCDPSQPTDAYQEILGLSGDDVDALRESLAERRDAIELLHQETT
ncbi:MAG: HDOD domain-containing protein [Myxococcota bacterium]|nr:HDOD domain-containing protein [Myxococcota bacterium]